MKEARAGVDGRDFEKMVSVEEEERIFGEGEGVFSAGKATYARGENVAVASKFITLPGYTEHADERADQACVQASLRANCSIQLEIIKKFENRNG